MFMSFKEFIKELNGSRVEGELIKTVFYSLLSSFIIFILLYFMILRRVTDFMPKYGFFLFFAILSFAILMPTIRQVRAYRELSCMSGMMIGMTSGMIAGFLPGFYIASTNGMFIGGMVGIGIGIILGIWTGKCCGIMGIMEGTMAGFMGGLMGAMTAFMLFNDHLMAASVIVFIIGAAICIGLNYLIFKETKETPRQLIEDHIVTIVISVILSAITIWLMVFGPRSGVFG